MEKPSSSKAGQNENICLGKDIKCEQGKKGIHMAGWCQSSNGKRRAATMVLSYPFNRTCYEEQSCLPAPSYLISESTATVTPGHHVSNASPSKSMSMVGMLQSPILIGGYLSIISCLDLFL